jgi:hypothetical protein
MNRHERRAAAAQGKNKILSTKAHALLALSCLWTLVENAKKQTDIITWRRVGGFEAEDFLDALEQGRPHPVVEAYEKRKAEVAHRPGPGLHEQIARRQIVRLSVALQRQRIGAKKARQMAIKALADLDLFANAMTHRVVEHWELESPLGPVDEKAIKTALARCGPNPRELVRHFTGLLQFGAGPFLRVMDSREGPPVTGDRDVP